MENKFRKPDADTVKRMTPQSLNSLLNTLRGKRATVVKPLDEEIAFYEKLLATKEEELRNKNQTRLQGGGF